MVTPFYLPNFPSLKALETPSCRVICCCTSSTDSAEPSSCPESAERATTRRSVAMAAMASGNAGHFSGERWENSLEMLQVGGVKCNFLWEGISIVNINRVRFRYCGPSSVFHGAESWPKIEHLESCGILVFHKTG